MIRTVVARWLGSALDERVRHLTKQVAYERAIVLRWQRSAATLQALAERWRGIARRFEAERNAAREEADRLAVELDAVRPVSGEVR